MMARMGRVLAAACCLLVVTVAMMFNAVDATVCKGVLKVGYYAKTCPRAEEIVLQAMENEFRKNKTVAPGVLRLQFHDCMIRGCDASLLLDGPTAEKSSPLNANLHGFELFDAAKAVLEKECPGVVSCADVLAFASRDAVVITGGIGWEVPAGRKDGLISNINDPLTNLPSSEMTVTQLLPFLTRKGLNIEQLVDLSGAHTIGITHCFFIQGRIFAFPSTKNHIDPSLPPRFLKTLQKTCPKNVTTPFAGNGNNPINLDSTPGRFDNGYFRALTNFNGVMTSDQTLYVDSRTKSRVIENVNFYRFSQNFISSMVALTSVDVKIGSQGQIRKNCRKVNS